jgi:hypothetical protein
MSCPVCGLPAPQEGLCPLLFHFSFLMDLGFHGVVVVVVFVVAAAAVILLLLLLILLLLLVML